MFYTREIQADLQKNLKQNKVIIVYGPRRAGKTTLLNKLIESKADYKKVNGEDLHVANILSKNNFLDLQQFLNNNSLLLIDEAQSIPNIGKTLKFIIDTFPDLTIIATGSTSFDLANKIGEPLTGRKKTFYLYPLSFNEVLNQKGFEYKNAILENFLLYGGYPEVQDLPLKEKIDYLIETTEAYLFKDILAFENIKNSQKLRDLLTLLAFQIGQEVSLTELGSQLSLNKETVARYLDLLEKTFVIFNIRGFSRNLRKEVSKTSRYYFYDLGIRNSLIKNFNPLNLRNDQGMLFENFVITERIKKQKYAKIHSNNYFWRTYDQQEIDWIEERDGQLHGYEIKFSPKKNPKPPKAWQETYPNASFQVITPENFTQFI